MPPRGPEPSPPSRRLLAAGLGLLCVVACAEAALRLGGAASAWLQQRRHVQAARARGVYRILCLGECTTWQQYPRLLAASLNDAVAGWSFAVTDAGMAGANSSDVLDRARTELERDPPDMVVAMMGVNDLGADRYDEDIPEAGRFSLQNLRIFRLARSRWLRPANEPSDWRVPPRIVHPSPGRPRPQDARPPEPTDLFALPPGPDSDRIYQAREAVLRQDYARAEKLLKEVVASDPSNDVALNELGLIYEGRRQLPQAVQAFARSARLAGRHLSGSGDAALGLGRAYIQEGRLKDAEAAFRKALQLMPRDTKARFALADFYRGLGRFPEAQKYYQEALELDPGNDWACAALALLYAKLGDPAQARLHERKTAELRSRAKPMTARNYRRLQSLLDAKGVRLVCAQYPMMSVEPLRRIFSDSADPPLFVDNEAVFREAVQRKSYAAYFRDLFGGDFGRCTPQGNQLLADSIAQAILRRYFPR
ncbi:MAG: tetratricopeptide repeat protein [Elusimicrobia bacterium]|nr:tetratricopeptide repeat protein [Elusimicrobiota bacterium]